MAKKARKAISPIIATVLLILIAIATGVIIYVFATGWVGGRLVSSGPQAVLTVEVASNTSIKNSSNKYVKVFQLYVRNDGGSNVNITRAYIIAPNGTAVQENLLDGKGAIIHGVPISPGQVGVINVTQNHVNIQPGYVYKVRLFTTDGSEVEYPIKV